MVVYKAIMHKIVDISIIFLLRSTRAYWFGFFALKNAIYNNRLYCWFPYNL
jgi:hypothetical protein